jgi:putative Ca2+/H+ antiporter (TMEM165/GDT1 family)
VDLGVAAPTFALVIPAELPDKTFMSCLVLSSRHGPLPVSVGAEYALVLQAGTAVVAEGLLALLPKLAVRSAVAALFLGGAVYLLASTEHAEQERGEMLAFGEEGALAGVVSFWRVAAITFGVVALAEFGDITQVLIANLSAHYRDRLAMFTGAALFALVSGTGVLAGNNITRFVPLAVVRRLSGPALLGFGIYSVVSRHNLRLLGHRRHVALSEVGPS